MYYYEVIPASKSYKGANLLTYSSVEELQIGACIVVMLRTKRIHAIVRRKVTKPPFTTKEITSSADAHIPEAYIDLALWMSQYYAVPLASCASLTTPPDFTRPTIETIAKIPPVQLLPEVTRDQKTVINDIEASNTSTHIIHGETGSGKTRIYIELSRKTIASRKSVVVLTPEISLAPQLTKSFTEQFSSVHVVHSQMTNAERRSVWYRLREPGPHVVIGPRSALFYPLDELGLVIIDEFHDAAYKQEQTPRYVTSHVAARLAKTQGAKLILGSATPPIEDYFYAVFKGAVVHRLTESAISHNNSLTTKVVDMRDTNERSHNHLLSKTLLAGIESTLAQKEQILLFLNKRGTSKKVLCQACGWQAICSRCDISYTYHHDSHTLICHTCGSSESVPHSCPKCSSADIIFKSPGTKQIEQSIKQLFPHASIGRYDKDNKKNESFAENYQSIQQGEVDILIGTQTLVKGHDLPQLGLVGVLLAENELKFPDYSSAERGFQLLRQIAGRVGRGHRSGTIIVQTYEADQKLLTALEQNTDTWQRFYDNELLHRKQFKFPPFVYLLKIECARSRQHLAMQAATKIHDQLVGKSGIEVSEPAPSFFEKRANKWHWQIIVKSSKRSDLIETIKTLPAGCSYDLDPTTLL